MLKLEYLNHTDQIGEFSILRFLINNNRNCSITNKDYRSKLAIEQVLNSLKIIFNTIEHIVYSYYTNKDKNIVIRLQKYNLFDADGNIESYIGNIEFYFTNNSNFEKYENKIKELLEYKDPVRKNTPVFNLITISNNAPKTLRRTIDKSISIDVENSYNLNCNLDDIVNDIKSDKSGLIIFSSEPGAGKSSLIKWLSQEIRDKKFFFLSNSNLHILSNPSFIEYCLEELQDSILVLEDCENALLSRNINKGFDISNILNITDGIIGDMMNMKIIATLNTTDKLDSALLRKGRLIRKVYFDKLKKEQVAKLSKSIGNPIDNPEEMMLTDVYNTLDNGVSVTSREAIGFSV